MSKIPYVVTIEETYGNTSRQNVIIMVDENNEEPHTCAEKVAEELCTADKIQLDFEDFHERTCRCQHEATENELRLLPIFDTNNIPDEDVPNACTEETIADHSCIHVGDTVIADYPHARIPLKGCVKKIYDNGYADVFIGKHGYNKITVAIDRLYHNHAEYNTAMDENARIEYEKTYERISTADGLLMFLSGNEMLCKGDASDAQWKAVMKRLDEVRIASLKGCRFD